MKLNVDERFKVGNEDIKNADYFSAVLRYSEAIGTSKISFKILLKRCECLMKMKDYKNAAKDALKCIEIDPNFRVPYYHAMDCLLMVGETSKVENLVTKFRSVAPSIDSINKNQVFKMNKLKDLKEDIVDFNAANDFVKCLYLINEALKIATADESLHFMKINMLITLQRLEEAEEANLALCGLLNKQINFKKALMAHINGDLYTASILFTSISCQTEKKLKAFEDIHGKLNRVLKAIKEGV